MRSVLVLFSAFALWTNHAAAQARVEYLNPQCMGSITATPIVQPWPQYVTPAMVTPLLMPETIESRPPAAVDYPPMCPPIIIQEDNDWHHLLYFLIFAMQNRRIDSFNQCSAPPSPYPTPYGLGYNSMLGDELTIMQAPTIQPIDARDNEVTLIIRTER